MEPLTGTWILANKDTIHDVDLHAFPGKSSKQQRNDTMLVKDIKKGYVESYASLFNLNHILANAIDNTYYWSTINSIQKANSSAKLPRLKNIYGELLDNKLEK